MAEYDIERHDSLSLTDGDREQVDVTVPAGDGIGPVPDKIHAKKLDSTISVLSKGSRTTTSTTSLSTKSTDSWWRQPNLPPARLGRLPWLLEFASWILALMVLAALAALLAAYDHQSLAAWHSQITLNALVSVLVTILYLLIMVPISASIAQLKWNQYSQSRPLINFQSFDAASRTAFGSLLLLFRNPRNLLAVLGALLTLVVTTVGPFVQQIVGISVVPRYQGNGTVSVLTNLEGSIYENQTSLYRAVSSGTYTTQPEVYEPKYECADRNCTWDSFYTLAMQSECVDTTHLIERSDYYYQPNPNISTSALMMNFSLPNGFYTAGANLTSHTVIMSNFTISNPSIYFKNRGLAMLDLHVMSVGITAPPSGNIDDAEPWHLASYECLLSLVGQEMRADYTSGRYSESIIGTPFTNDTNTTDFGSGWQINAGSLYNYSIDIVSPSGTNLNVNATFAAGLYGEIFRIMESSDTAEGAAGIIKRLLGQRSSNFTVPDLMQNLALSMTQWLRTVPLTVSAQPGPATSQVVVYSVRWAWISIPAALQVLVLILLGLTVTDTVKKGLPKWTDSSLAAIVYGADEQTRGMLRGECEVDGLESAARTTLVKMDTTSRALKLA